MNYQVSANNNAGSIAVHEGDTVEIQLDETPTSGYAWELDSMNSNIAELVSNEYKLHDGAGIGGGGKRVMKFLVHSKGNGSIKLKNWQRWSGDIYRQFKIDVESQ